MTLSTYTGLRDAIGTTLGRSDLTSSNDVTADFITLAEAEINRLLKIRRMIGRASATINQEYSTVPSDFAAPRSMKITSVTPTGTLEWTSPEAMADDKALWNTSTGQPTKYTVVGNEFEYDPVPGGDYTVALTYYKRITPLADGVNWLLTAWPDIYLFGACKQAAAYLDDGQTEDRFEGKFQKAIAQAQAADIHESTGARLSVGQPFAP